MKGFALDSSGDLIIENNQIQVVSGDDLIRQTVERVVNTNKEEWFLNLEEGVTFSNLLGKNISEEIVRNEIEQVLLQIDSSFFIESLSYDYDSQSRKLTVKFTAKNENGDTAEEVNIVWG